MDLRERVVAAVDDGMTQPQAAARFGVGLRTVERYLARRRATGSLAPDEQRHGAGAEEAAAVARLTAGRLEVAADATLDEHVQAFVAAGGEPVSMSRAIASSPPESGAELTPSGRRRAGRRG